MAGTKAESGPPISPSRTATSPVTTAAAAAVTAAAAAARSTSAAEGCDGMELGEAAESTAAAGGCRPSSESLTSGPLEEAPKASGCTADSAHSVVPCEARPATGRGGGGGGGGEAPGSIGEAPRSSCRTTTTSASPWPAAPPPRAASTLPREPDEGHLALPPSLAARRGDNTMGGAETDRSRKMGLLDPQLRQPSRPAFSLPQVPHLPLTLAHILPPESHVRFSCLGDPEEATTGERWPDPSGRRTGLLLALPTILLPLAPPRPVKLATRPSSKAR
mmetsp:Transcript_60836/g.162727  ORF Transcript_60836/g.162727 Transcript_60836/m.162727 type:complete len:276 (+) Transcript_60836:325-1152(+)